MLQTIQLVTTYLNTKQVKVSYSDKFAIQIPTLIKNKNESLIWNFVKWHLISEHTWCLVKAWPIF